MIIVHVFVHVKPDCIEAFRQASIQNAQHSIQESGVARFDVIREMDDPTRFVLIEAYRTEADTARHKETDHYRIWRDAVNDMMAEPRSSIRYVNIHPNDSGWG